MADGTVLRADVVYVCFGSRPNSESVASFSSFGTEDGRSSESDTFFSLTGRRNVVVRDTLQLVTTDDDDSTPTPWFACGDVAKPPTDDEKQAFQAEMQGKVAARNVVRLLESSATTTKRRRPGGLLRYPRDIAGADRIPLVFVLSLGRYDGVLGFNSLCVPGPLAAVVKWILEYTKVSHMRGCLFGKLVWKIGDAVTLFLSRTVFRPSSSSTMTSVTASPKKQ